MGRIGPDAAHGRAATAAQAQLVTHNDGRGGPAPGTSRQNHDHDIWPGRPVRLGRRPARAYAIRSLISIALLEM